MAGALPPDGGSSGVPNRCFDLLDPAACRRSDSGIQDCGRREIERYVQRRVRVFAGLDAVNELLGDGRASGGKGVAAVGSTSAPDCPDFDRPLPAHHPRRWCPSCRRRWARGVCPRGRSSRLPRERPWHRESGRASRHCRRRRRTGSADSSSGPARRWHAGPNTRSRGRPRNSSSREGRRRRCPTDATIRLPSRHRSGHRRPPYRPGAGCRRPVVRETDRFAT